jgi:hypothetical protein
MTKMPESASTRYRRRLRMVDNAILNAIADLYPYYCVVLHADPILGAACEHVILDLERLRETMHKIYVLAWEQDHEQFKTIGDAAEIIQQKRYEERLGGRLCRDFSSLWAHSVKESSKLLEQRAEALRKQLALRQSKRETSNQPLSPMSLNKSPD